MSHFDDALQRARRLSDAFGMHPNGRNGEVSVTEGDNEAYYHISPLGEGETVTLTPEKFAQWRAEHDSNNWTQSLDVQGVSMRRVLATYAGNVLGQETPPNKKGSMII